VNAISRLLFVVCTSFITVFLSAQQQQGTKTAAQTLKKKGNNASTQMVHSTLHDTCLDKKFSVVFYMIQDSLGSKTIANTANFRNTAISVLNSVFKRICVSFESCSTVVIPVYPYNEWVAGVADLNVVPNWYTDKTINIYLPDIVEPAHRERHAYAYAPNVQGAYNSTLTVLVASTGTQAANSFGTNEAGVTGSAIVHAMGHLFGLPDTFSEFGPPASPSPTNNVVSHEFVRRNNCSVNGDQFCDTEADPFPLHFWPGPVRPPKTHCDYEPGVLDATGVQYTPPLDNFMSLYNCRCRFTQQQYNHMARYILKNRMHLH
jgi:hypothetical protein